MWRDASKFSPLFEIARLLVCFDHVACFVVNANRSVPICLAKLPRFFQNSAHMKTKTSRPTNSLNRSPLRCGLLFILLALVCVPLAMQAQTCQQGCLGNYNTVLGDDVLINNTTGKKNTAVGFDALYSNTTGFYN